MEKKYEAPELEIIELDNKDIVTASGCEGVNCFDDCETYGISGSGGTGGCTKDNG